MSQALRTFEIVTSLAHLVGFAVSLAFVNKDRVVPLKRGYVVYPEDGGQITYGYEDGTSISIVGLIAGTFALSFFFQFVPAVFLWKSTYARLYSKGIQYWRWIEYSFSATTLFLAGAAANGLREVSTALLIFGSMWVLMMLGLVQELVAYYLKQLRHPKIHVVEFFLPSLLGWVPYIFLWVVAFDSMANNNKHAVPHKSNALFAFYVFEFLAFSSFGINQAVQMARFYTNLQIDNIGRIAVQHEWVYAILSLTSKVIGAGILLSGGLSLKGHY